MEKIDINRFGEMETFVRVVELGGFSATAHGVHLHRGSKAMPAYGTAPPLQVLYQITQRTRVFSDQTYPLSF